MPALKGWQTSKIKIPTTPNSQQQQQQQKKKKKLEKGKNYYQQYHYKLAKNSIIKQYH